MKSFKDLSKTNTPWFKTLPWSLVICIPASIVLYTFIKFFPPYMSQQSEEKWEEMNRKNIEQQGSSTDGPRAISGLHPHSIWPQHIKHLNKLCKIHNSNHVRLNWGRINDTRVSANQSAHSQDVINIRDKTKLICSVACAATNMPSSLSLIHTLFSDISIQRHCLVFKCRCSSINIFVPPDFLLGR